MPISVSLNEKDTEREIYFCQKYQMSLLFVFVKDLSGDVGGAPSVGSGVQVWGVRGPGVGGQGSRCVGSGPQSVGQGPKCRGQCPKCKGQGPRCGVKTWCVVKAPKCGVKGPGVGLGPKRGWVQYEAVSTSGKRCMLTWHANLTPCDPDDSANRSANTLTLLGSLLCTNAEASKPPK